MNAQTHYSTVEGDALVARCRRVMLALGWRHPGFLPAVARVEVKADPTIPTACAERRGVVRISPAYAARIDDATLGFVMAHELCHLMLQHWRRRGSRDVKRWNKAADRAINQALRSAKIAAPPDVLYPAPGNEDFTAEQHYDVEPEDDGDGGSGDDGDDNIEPGKGCGPRGGDGDAPSNGEDDAEAKAEREWREIAAQASALDRQAGQQSGHALSRLLTIPPARVKWAQILRGALTRAIAEHGRDDVSWSRRSRRTIPGVPALPGGVTSRARVAVVIDTSGSMSDDDLRRCVAETVAILKHAKVGAYLVVHDHNVQWQGWIHGTARAPEVSRRLVGRGGTAFGPAYRAVENAKIRGGRRFDCAVHLTDGECFDRWPTKPRNVRRLVVGLLGSACRAQIPAEARVVECDV